MDTVTEISTGLLKTEWSGGRPDIVKANILIVDDQPENLVALDAVLADLQQNVLMARSGEEALKYLLDNEVVVVLLDVKMPVLDGFETAELIRQRAKFRQTPIIFVTAINTLEEDVSRGYSLGAVDYLFKPFAPEVLRSKVSVFVELFLKSEKLKSQAERLHQMEIRDVARREQEKRLADAKRHSEELAAANMELTRSNEDLEQFAYVASHDLKEPLRKVTNYVQMLEKGAKGRLDPKVDLYLTKIVEGTDQMSTLINDLLAYSRVAKGKPTLDTVDLESVFLQTVCDLEWAIQKSKAQVTHDPLPRLQANAPQMVQLFQNLISNAVKFHGAKPPRVHVAARMDGGESVWKFSVTDNGIGIDPKYFDRIFVIFQRLHNRADYPGTGMGLSICKKIVERHGGRIWVESKPAEGAAFYFTLPVTP